jgi:hypothetical protein
MKLFRIAVAVVFATAFGSAYAFHSGGVAECEGCHTMHNTVGSGRQVPLAKGVGQGAIYLLQGTDQSSACLNCHNSADSVASSYHISTDDSMFTQGLVNYADTNTSPVELTPGGDFGWLKVDRNVTVRSKVTQVFGEERGHSINAVDYGYNKDGRNTLAPGGTYPGASLHCSSCHDPHGRYRRDAAGAYSTTGLPIANSGSYNNSNAPVAGVYAVGAYRILGGIGYAPKSTPGYDFTAGTPDAVAPSTYNRSEATGQTHVAYGRGMSEWCANCHPKMLENAYVSGAVNHRHPAGNGAKLTFIAANYNSYVSSGRMTNTDLTKAYSTLAPFELGIADATPASYATLKTLAVNTDTLDQSAQPTSNVSCLSCHRAHAGAFPAMTRFFLENEFMTIGDGAGVASYDNAQTENKINYGLNPTETTNAYYGRAAAKFGPWARNYCNKCHAKD